MQTTTETVNPDPDITSAANTSPAGQAADNKAETEASTNSSPVKSTASKAAAFLSAKMSSTDTKKSAKTPEDCKF